jgi:hypothetical protein
MGREEKGKVKVKVKGDIYIQSESAEANASNMWAYKRVSITQIGFTP